jgi:ClpX C4-type zinc finger
VNGSSIDLRLLRENFYALLFLPRSIGECHGSSAPRLCCIAQRMRLWLVWRQVLQWYRELDPRWKAISTWRATSSPRMRPIVMAGERSVTMTASACYFCNRTVGQVTHLIQGPELAICDICVDACIDTLATRDVGWRERQIDYLPRLRNRKTLAAGN